MQTKRKLPILTFSVFLKVFLGELILVVLFRTLLVRVPSGSQTLFYTQSRNKDNTESGKRTTDFDAGVTLEGIFDS